MAVDMSLTYMTRTEAFGCACHAKLMSNILLPLLMEIGVA
jgi:hypothetical protein